MSAPTCPDGLDLWTADEVAECLGVSDRLRGRLWNMLAEAKNPTPLGGDGSNGTVETPDARRDPDNDDKIGNLWPKLTESERDEIAAAWKKEGHE